jgi:hypothetical protein
MAFSRLKNTQTRNTCRDNLRLAALSFCIAAFNSMMIFRRFAVFLRLSEVALFLLHHFPRAQ